VVPLESIIILPGADLSVCETSVAAAGVVGHTDNVLVRTFDIEGGEIASGKNVTITANDVAVSDNCVVIAAVYYGNKLMALSNVICPAGTANSAGIILPNGMVKGNGWSIRAFV